MKSIEEKILASGKIIDNDILKVDSFLNHQIDIPTIREFAEEVARQFKGQRIDKVLTIETSGIAVAYAVCEALGDIPMVFAKKKASKTVGSDVYRTSIKSFTRDVVTEVTVAQDYLNEGERVLLIDDFLAEGNAAFGLIHLCEQAGARVVGVAVVIEKLFQGGRARLEEKGIRVFAGASIRTFHDNKPVF